MTTVTLRSVQAPQVGPLWPAVWEMLEPAMNRLGKRYRSADVERDVLANRKHLWLADRDGEIVTAALTEIVLYDDCKSFNILAISGDGFGLWRQWFADFEEIARGIGCKMIEGLGRPGWGHLVEGLRPVAVLYAKEL